jgi:opacity protein-like surface antigen
MLKRVFIFAVLMVCSASVLAQYDHPRKKDRVRNVDSRDARYEASIMIPYQLGADESGANGESLEVDSAIGWGFLLGWNWTEHVNLSYKFMMTKPKYEATLIPDDLLNSPVTVDYKMEKTSHQVNATYNILSGAFTPFVSGGIGYTKLNSNIPNGHGQSACWWDPWYGYICATDWETYKTSEFTYNVGVGVRWDFSDFMFTKAAYSREFLSIDKGSLDFDYMAVELGLLF